ncbi:hypothetical protein PG995_005720 [Apiospora arundinis]
MADPLSVAGLAAGVVSLGLQVASGIASYLDAIKGRQEEVASVKRELDSITSTLQRLDSICSQPQAQHPASTRLRQSIEACRIELDNFGNIPACIQSPNPRQGPSNSAQNVDARLFKKLRETQENLAYPLRHAPKVQKLASRLRNLRQSLQTSLQEVTFELLSSMAQSAVGVQMDIALTRTETQEISMSTRAIQDAVPDLKSDIANMQPMIQGILQSHYDSQHQQLQACLAQIKELVQGTTMERSLLSLSTDYRQLELSKSIIGRRTTKPDNLKPFARATQLNTGRDICDCPIRKGRLHTRYRWASTIFFTQTESVMHHLPGCKFALQPSHDSSRIYGIAFNTGVYRIISKAIQISVSLSCRAGTTSIAPIIKYHTMVDHTRAPVFRLVSLLGKSVELMQNTYFSEYQSLITPSQMKYDLDRLLRHCFSSILVLFHQKKGSPTDVDYLHQSLVHRLLIILLDPLLDFLLSLNMPLMAYDVDGRLGFVSDAAVAYANELVRQRNQLKQIAKLYLPESRHEDLGLESSAILDANAFRVVGSLQEMRICLDPKLYQSTNIRDGESIFHQITTPEWADFFYNLGFKDLSACTDNPKYIDDVEYFMVRCDATEVQEIQSENSDEIERFHQIVDSLTEELESVLAGNLNIDLGTAKNYIETTWMERMKLEMKNYSEEDMEELVERTRELGVVWQGPLPSDSVHDDGPYRPTRQQITSLEFWMDEADRIVRGEGTLIGV